MKIELTGDGTYFENTCTTGGSMSHTSFKPGISTNIVKRFCVSWVELGDCQS